MWSTFCGLAGRLSPSEKPRLANEEAYLGVSDLINNFAVKAHIYVSQQSVCWCNPYLRKIPGDVHCALFFYYCLRHCSTTVIRIGDKYQKVGRPKAPTICTENRRPYVCMCNFNRPTSISRLLLYVTQTNAFRCIKYCAYLHIRSHSSGGAKFRREH